jgi:hypothetical protein
MPEPLESEPAGVTLESDALPQEDFPPGDVRRRPEAPGNLHLGQAAAVPTYGLLQVNNEDPLHLIPSSRQAAVRLYRLPRRVAPRPHQQRRLSAWSPWGSPFNRL